jgi:L-threonylcarbamoyladenylate synthase
VISLESPGVLSLAVKALNGGGVAVIPTDTVYGLAARLDQTSAIERIFELKGRPRSKPLPVLVPDIAEANRLARLPPEALRMAAEVWPGPLTLVVQAVSPLGQIGGDGWSVGLRVPNHPFTLELLKRCGPLATTSANRSGRSTGVTVEGVMEDLGEGIDLYVDGGALTAVASQVISFIGEPRKLR